MTGDLECTDYKVFKPNGSYTFRRYCYCATIVCQNLEGDDAPPGEFMPEKPKPQKPRKRKIYARKPLISEEEEYPWITPVGKGLYGICRLFGECTCGLCKDIVRENRDARRFSAKAGVK